MVSSFATPHAGQVRVDSSTSVASDIDIPRNEQHHPDQQPNERQEPDPGFGAPCARLAANPARRPPAVSTTAPVPRGFPRELTDLMLVHNYIEERKGRETDLGRKTNPPGQ